MALNDCLDCTEVWFLGIRTSGCPLPTGLWKPPWGVPLRMDSLNPVG